MFKCCGTHGGLELVEKPCAVQLPECRQLPASSCSTFRICLSSSQQRQPVTEHGGMLGPGTFWNRCPLLSSSPVDWMRLAGLHQPRRYYLGLSLSIPISSFLFIVSGLHDDLGLWPVLLLPFFILQFLLTSFLNFSVSAFWGPNRHKHLQGNVET